MTVDYFYTNITTWLNNTALVPKMNVEEEEFLNQFQGEILEGIIDLLILQSDSISDFSTEPTGPPLVVSVLSSISQTEEYWLHVIKCAVRKVPHYAINVINDIITDMPCPTVETVNRLFREKFQLSSARAANPRYNRQAERNICVVLSCLANKLAGGPSTRIFTRNVCNYLFQFFVLRHRSRQLLMAFLTLEKFAVTSENKIKIEQKLAQLGRNPLLDLLEYDNSDDCVWRQIGFCARWALDNTFTVPGRQPSYLSVDMSRINVIFNQNTQRFMKISPDGLEVRCDTSDFGTLRATCEVTRGSFYFEVRLITGGPMRIGLATSESKMTDTYAIGSDENSIGYDGSTRCLWSEGASRYMFGIQFWRPGYVFGFHVNTIRRKIHLVQNRSIVTINMPEFFDNPRRTKRFYPAVTMAPYVQCRFNFGSEPFVYRVPEEGPYSTFNEVGQLTPEQKMVKPRNLFQMENSVFNENNNACKICYDNPVNAKLLPCGHDTFCRACASRFRVCPICRIIITSRI
ncbi:RING finger and SPRY domain-containing protein 1-like isoform X1 [Papilio machaon]|uniref:RING finger and SPRY domain-containing protein 1-like isoform X1 n=2 Tax=Papilio machaon TaxID=76193 RepID=UPI001E6636E1|nr:RING finger and SPRY domain-containing protein 1-like isoform X1 [Papilio machaon]